jgi:hypothetical protein
MVFVKMDIKFINGLKNIHLNIQNGTVKCTISKLLKLYIAVYHPPCIFQCKAMLSLRISFSWNSPHP